MTAPVIGATSLAAFAAACALAAPARAVPERVSETYSSGNIAVPVAESAANAIGVRGGGPIAGVQVSVRLSHPAVRLLAVKLVSPSGDDVRLLGEGIASNHEPVVRSSSRSCKESIQESFLPHISKA